jgi:hypothetical protein
MSKTFSKILTKQFDVSFSSTFFVLSRFRVFLSDGSSKTLQKTFCKKKHIEKINLTLVLFRTLTHPPTTGVTDFFFLAAPCRKNRTIKRETRNRRTSDICTSQLVVPARKKKYVRTNVPYFLSFLLLVRFWAFLGKGSSKTRETIEIEYRFQNKSP